MRILVATDVSARGGVDGYVRDLVQALRSSGHDTLLAVEETTRSALRNEAWVDVQPQLARMYHRRHRLADLYADATALLDGSGCDGVHVVCGSPLSCLALRDTVVQKTLPLIITEQQVKHEFAVLSADAARIRNSYLHAQQVIFVSAGNRDIMSDAIGLRGVNSTVIANGVDAESVQVRSSAAALSRQHHDSGIKIMTAARLAPEKALHIFVLAVSGLPPLGSLPLTSGTYVRFREI